MQFLGENLIPFCIVFTKSDKLKSGQLDKNIKSYKSEMLNTWEEMPPLFVSSAMNKAGREEILSYIDSINRDLNQN